MKGRGPSEALQRAAIAAYSSEAQKRSGPGKRGSGQSALSRDMKARERGEWAPTQGGISKWLRTNEIGFDGVRAICAFLGLSEDELIRHYDPELVTMTIPVARKGRKRTA